MVKVNFILRKRGQTKYPVYPILMRVSFNGKRMELSTGLHACEIQWNKESQRVKIDVNGMMPKSYVNAGLEQLSGVVQLANSDSYRKGQILTDNKVSNAVATLRARLARTVKHNEGKESANATKHADECAKTKRGKYYEGAYQDFMRREGESKGWSKSSREKYNSMWNHVRKMERMKGFSWGGGRAEKHDSEETTGVPAPLSPLGFQTQVSHHRRLQVLRTIYPYRSE